MFKREGSLSLFRKPVECYFCGTPCPSARLSSPSSTSGQAGCSFRCSECQCYNRYDYKGRIISDDPAMHDESMNTRSFARRASPRKNRLPSEYTSSNLFCQNCKTNQTLLMNLRASFLPGENDPEYERRLAQWPTYEQSLYARYPPVCENCEDNVSKEIARKDALARSTALGGFLKDSRSKDRTRTAVAPRRTRVGADKSLVVWYVRGALWVLTTLSALIISGTLALGSHILDHPYLNSRFIPTTALVSLMWTFWDPGYLSARKAQRKGRYVRSDQRRRGQYIRLQGIAWLLRLLSSSFLMMPDFSTMLPRFLGSYPSAAWYFSVVLAAELLILTMSFMTLRPSQAPQVQLHDRHNSHSRLSEPPNRLSTPAPSRPASSEADLLAPLSLSSHPVFPSIGSGAVNPVFGASSLHAPPARFQSAPAPSRQDDDGDAVMVDEDAMDWQPASPQKPQGPVRTNGDASWIRPQRFFAPEQPTGLESLLERTGLSDVVPAPASSATPAKGQSQLHWSWVYACSLIPVVAILVYLWLSYLGLQEAKRVPNTVHSLPLLAPSSGTSSHDWYNTDQLDPFE